MASKAKNSDKTSIFTEKPYALAVENEFITSVCPNCYTSGAMFPCPKECGCAFYCNESCSKEDSDWHQFECGGFRNLVSIGFWPLVDTHIRLVGRILTRLRVDDGRASLSTGFPKYAKERQFNDLLSHYDDIKKNSGAYECIRSLVYWFRKFFASTQLGSTPVETIERLLCVCYINTFSLTEGDDAIGLALYLNTSRFNHSCVPTAEARFLGSSIEIYARPNVHADEYNTESRFDGLTIDYGTAVTASYGCWITTTRQRVDSLKSRYYFRCICSACANSIVALVEERAAVVECAHCGLPYVWTKNCNAIKSVCSCNKRVTVQVNRDTRLEAKQLEKLWKDSMESTKCQHAPKKAIREFEPLLEVAKLYWHAKRNVRLAQIMERLTMAYNKAPATALTAQGKKRRDECKKVVQEWYLKCGCTGTSQQ